MAITINNLHRVMIAIWNEVSSNDGFTGFSVQDNTSNISVNITKIIELTGFTEIQVKRKTAILERLNFISIQENEEGTFYYVLFPHGLVASMGTAENLICYIQKTY